MTMILLSATTMLLLALIMAWVLGWANRAFHVPVDPLVEKIDDALPGVNCGGCGYVGCREYAEAVAAGKAKPTLCTVGGESVAQALASLTGAEAEPGWPYRPAVHCGASYADRLGRTAYHGEPTCAAANLVGGVQGCAYGCLGFGDCEKACPFDAIHVVDGLATVDYERCVGCGACEKACPRHIISMVPFKRSRMVVITCSNKDSGKDVKAVCKVGCIGCTACQRNAKGLVSMRENVPVIDYDQYDPEHMEALELAVTKCPMKRLLFIGRPPPEEADDENKPPELVVPDFQTTVDRTEWQG